MIGFAGADLLPMLKAYGAKAAIARSRIGRPGPRDSSSSAGSITLPVAVSWSESLPGVRDDGRRTKTLYRPIVISRSAATAPGRTCLAAALKFTALNASICCSAPIRAASCAPVPTAEATGIVQLYHGGAGVGLHAKGMRMLLRRCRAPKRRRTPYANDISSVMPASRRGEYESRSLGGPELT